MRLLLPGALNETFENWETPQSLLLAFGGLFRVNFTLTKKPEYFSTNLAS